MFKRSPNNPILKPIDSHKWESKKVYNCGTIFDKNKYHLFYRAVGENWISSIGYATSSDGDRFKRGSEPLIVPKSKKEKKGVEDPRITKIKNTYFLTYTAFDSKTARLSLATSKNKKKWKKTGVILPSWNLFKAGGFLIKWDDLQKKYKNPNWSKAGGIFPKIIDNKYWMLFGDSNIWLAHSKNGIKWTPELTPFLEPRKKHFDSAHVEMGPPPIKTKKGWLVLYHGIDKKIVYRLGFLILDINNPKKILYRSNKPIFEPKKPYEISGLVDILPGGFQVMEKMSEKNLKIFINKNKKIKRMPKVAFCNGATLVNNTLKIYYGASDSVICTAKTNINNILKLIK